MKRLTALVAAGIIASTATQAGAVDPDKPLTVPATVTIVAFDQLEATALALHPGSTLLDTDLDEAYGKYIYEVELKTSTALNGMLNWTRSPGRFSRIIRIRNEGKFTRQQPMAAGAHGVLLKPGGARPQSR